MYYFFFLDGTSTFTNLYIDMKEIKSNLWPFVEARKLASRFNNIEKECCVFQTGYGPSGLPHIGTFGEVLRTSMVIKAFKNITDMPTKLYVFSDDMDGLRRSHKIYLTKI